MNDVAQGSVKGVNMKKLETIETEEKRAQAEHARLASFPERNPNPILEVDLDGKLTYQNPAAQELLSQLRDLKLLDVLVKELNALTNEFKVHRKQNFVRENVKIGDRYYLQSICYFSENAVLRLYMIDVTKRKQTELALKQSEEKYRKQFEEALDAIFLADAETGIIIDCNRAASRLVGREKTELIGKHQRILHPPEKIEEEFTRTFKQHLQEKDGQVLETQVITRNGEMKDVAIKANVFELEDKRIVQGAFRDITQHKKAEDAVRQERERLEIVTQNVGAGLAIISKDYRTLWANKVLKDKFGDVEGKICYSTYNQRNEICSRCGVREVLETGKAEVVNEQVGKDVDDKTIWSEIIATPIKDNDGNIIAVLELVVPITERKKAEDELKESEEKYRNLVENARDVIMTFDLKGNVTSINKAAAEYGFKIDEIIGKNIRNFASKRYWPKMFTDLAKAALGKSVEGEIEIITPIGQKYVEYRSNPIRQDEKVVGLQTILRDVTERKKMEEQLKEYSELLEKKVEERTNQLKKAHEQLLNAERLATIGEITTMVGHDLRNPLQSIENAAYYLKTELPCLSASEKGKEMLQVIDKSVNYADKIVRDLHDFSEGKAPALEQTDVNTLVEETLSQIQTPGNVELRTELRKLPQVIVDKDQMKRVFMNLTQNGVQAMENGGTLTVSTEKAEGFVEISFTDMGVGIHEENMEKIFSPFFTTKATGMGMGLAICKKFVENNGGTIQVKSEVGKGTTVVVKLSLTQETRGEKQ